MPKFAKGNTPAPGARGGKRPGSGRKPDWFKEKMAELACSEKAVAFVQAMIEGGDVDEFITQQGECIPHRARAEARLKALEFAAGYGVGKPAQPVEHSGEIAGPQRFDIVIESVKVTK